MSVDTVARFVISLTANPEQLKAYRASDNKGRLEMVKGLDARFWPLDETEVTFLELGNFDFIFKYLDEHGERGINQIKT